MSITGSLLIDALLKVTNAYKIYFLHGLYITDSSLHSSDGVIKIFRCLLVFCWLFLKIAPFPCFLPLSPAPAIKVRVCVLCAWWWKTDILKGFEHFCIFMFLRIVFILNYINVTDVCILYFLNVNTLVFFFLSWHLTNSRLLEFEATTSSIGNKWRDQWFNKPECFVFYRFLFSSTLSANQFLLFFSKDIQKESRR